MPTQDIPGDLATHTRTHTRRRGEKCQGSNPVSSSSHLRQGDSDSTINDHRWSPHINKRRGLRRTTPNSPPHELKTRQLRLWRRALQGESAGPASSQRRNRPPVSCHRHRESTSSAAPTSGRQVRLDNPSNTPDETDYQSSAAAQLRLKPPSLPHKKLRHITIAGRTPAGRNAASVQPMERANGIQSSSRRHPKEGSDDVDAAVRPDRALGFHPKSWN
uniref:Uncharacterized protein n=1 Tax=Aegilops tauschii TaxID=37682 RepID=N1QQL4_AEGTA